MSPPWLCAPELPGSQSFVCPSTVLPLGGAPRSAPLPRPALQVDFDLPLPFPAVAAPGAASRSRAAASTAALRACPFISSPVVDCRKEDGTRTTPARPSPDRRTALPPSRLRVCNHGAVGRLTGTVALVALLAAVAASAAAARPAKLTPAATGWAVPVVNLMKSLSGRVGAIPKQVSDPAVLTKGS